MTLFLQQAAWVGIFLFMGLSISQWATHSPSATCSSPIQGSLHGQGIHGSST